MPTTDDPKEIADEILKRTGAAIISGDFETFMHYMHLPQRVTTPEGSVLMTQTGDIRRVFNNVQTFLLTNNVREMVRNCLEATFRDEHTIATTHETRWINADTMLVLEPYPAFSILRYVDGVWKVAEMDGGMKENSALGKAVVKDGC